MALLNKGIVNSLNILSKINQTDPAMTLQLVIPTKINPHQGELLFY